MLTSSCTVDATLEYDGGVAGEVDSVVIAQKKLELTSTLRALASCKEDNLHADSRTSMCDDNTVVEHDVKAIIAHGAQQIYW